VRLTTSATAGPQLKETTSLNFQYQISAHKLHTTEDMDGFPREKIAATASLKGMIVC